MPAAAIVGSALIGGGLSYLGSRDQAKAATNAANAQKQGADSAAQLQWNMYQQNRSDMAPWRQAGQDNLMTLADLMKPGGYLTQTFDNTKFTADPGYDFRLNQGAEAIKRLSAANGKFFSGGMGKALDEYNQNYASNEFANAYSRYMNNQNSLYNRLAGLSNTGQVAASDTGNWGMSAANSAGRDAISGANAIGQGYMNDAGARACGYSGIADAIGAGVKNYLYYDLNKKPAVPGYGWGGGGGGGLWG